MLLNTNKSKMVAGPACKCRVQWLVTEAWPCVPGTVSLQREESLQRDCSNMQRRPALQTAAVTTDTLGGWSPGLQLSQPQSVTELWLDWWHPRGHTVIRNKSRDTRYSEGGWVKLARCWYLMLMHNQINYLDSMVIHRMAKLNEV